MPKKLSVAAALLLISMAAVPQASAAVCTATRECVGAAPVQCQGNSGCDSLASGVQCDGGAITSCPGAASSVGYVETHCPVPPFSHAFILSSFDYQGAVCNATSVSTTCGGATQTCYYCELHPNECDMPADG